jgi:MFS family permease
MTDTPALAPPPVQPEPPYAWVVVWACFGSLALIFGVSYSFAAFFASFAVEFSAQRADVALVFGLCGLIYFVLGVGGGMLADRFGPRAVCMTGMVCIAAGLLGTSLAQSMATVYLCYGVGIGIGVALVYTPSIACVQPRFTRRRGLAAGIASAGIGAGTLVVPLLATGAIAWLQWRDALRLLALAVLVLGLGAVLAAPSMFVPFAHVSAAARDAGIDTAQAVGLVGLIGIGSLVGRLVIGALADRLGRTLTLVLMQGAMGATYLLWAGAASYPLFALFALCFGLSYGGIVSLLPALCMDYFGARAVASIIGMLYSGAALGNLLGPVLAGLVFDHTGSYKLVIWACLALSALATGVSARLVVGKVNGPQRVAT